MTLFNVRLPKMKKKNNGISSTRTIGCENEDVYNGVYIPTSYRDKVLKHLILNYANDVNGFTPPLFLAIQGNKGEGKTFMLNKLCNYYDIMQIPLSGSELCGANEGDSKKIIRSAYSKACIEMSQDNKMRVIVIDDFHMSIAGNFSPTMTITENVPVLIGNLMNLADRPYTKECPSHRVPIILTGNDFSNIYAPLTRSGRLEFFKWEPVQEEKVKIVYFMFKKFYARCDYGEITKLVSAYKDMYVAFFQGILHDIFFGGFDDIIEEFHNNRNKYSVTNMNSLLKNNIKVSSQISLDIMMEYAEKRIRNKGKKYEGETS